MNNVYHLIRQVKNSQKTLFILCGFPYAGKSYIAKQIQSKTDIVYVSIDDIFYARGFDWDSNTLPDSLKWKQIFNESYEETKKALRDGKNVLYDSTNQTVVSRDTLRQTASSVDMFEEPTKEENLFVIDN